MSCDHLLNIPMSFHRRISKVAAIHMGKYHGKKKKNSTPSQPPMAKSSCRRGHDNRELNP